ncbi:hypothetical protein ACFX2I_013263 [Malus domestica]
MGLVMLCCIKPKEPEGLDGVRALRNLKEIDLMMQCCIVAKETNNQSCHVADTFDFSTILRRHQHPSTDALQNQIVTVSPDDCNSLAWKNKKWSLPIKEKLKMLGEFASNSTKENGAAKAK